jgi:sec-independent protein translocase protein TatA
MNLGGGELLIVLAVVLVLFGGAKLPKLARSLGQAQGEFKKGLNEETSQPKDESDSSSSSSS